MNLEHNCARMLTLSKAVTFMPDEMQKEGMDKERKETSHVTNTFLNTVSF